jgi:tol-pal system protein YbgF
MPRPAQVIRAAVTTLILGCAVSAAQAFFNDDEARKAIVDLRNRVTAVEDAGKAKTAELAAANAQLIEQLTALRRSLLDLNNQLETMRGELAKLRGNDEQLMRDLAEMQARQKDVSQTLDDRLRKIEPVKVSIDGREAVVEQEEKRAYEEAIAAIRGGEFDKAVVQLANFQRRFIGSAYTDSVRFWQGNALYGKRDYREAINAFRAFVTAAPDHPRAPEALLALANSQAEMKNPAAARRTIEELTKSYPDSEAAQAGKERLASIK